MKEEASVIDTKIFHHRVCTYDSDDENEDADGDNKKCKTNFNQAIEKRIKERERIQEAIQKKEHQVEEMLDNIHAAVKRRNKAAVAKMLADVTEVKQKIAELVRFKNKERLAYKMS